MATKTAEKESRDRVAEPDQKLGARIVRMRDKDEVSWADMASELEMSAGKVMFIYLQMTEDPVTGTEAKVNKAIVSMRNKGASWGVISARTGFTEGYCRRVFEEDSGESSRGHRVGKGGRYPAGEGPAGDAKPKPKKAPAKGAAKKAAKKAPAKKAAKKAPAKAKSLGDMTLEDLQDRLNGGKRITMKDGDKMVVNEVTGLDGDDVTFVDSDGDTMVIDRGEIKSATK